MRLLLLSLFCTLSFTLFSQRDALLKDISLVTCECIKNANEAVGFEMKIGICMLQAASPRSEEISKTLGIDLSDLTSYEKMGEILAPSLIANCPEFMTLMMDAAASGEINFDSDDDEMIFEEEVEEPFSTENGNSWSDINSASVSEAPEYGGPENKKFITVPLENTNGSGLIKPVVSGKITDVSGGLSSEITLAGKDSQVYVLYLTTQLANVNKLKKGKSVTLTYQEKAMYHAGMDKRTPVKVITRIE